MPRQSIRFSPVPQQLQRGLVPINGSNWLITPNEPADPWDCNRYPRSLYCGGNPFSLTPVGFGAEPIINNCYVGIEIEPILFFTRSPPIQIVRTFPDCREPKDPKPLPDKRSVTKLPKNCSGGNDVIMVISSRRVIRDWSNNVGATPTNQYGGDGKTEFIYKLSRIEYPGTYISPVNGQKAIISVTGSAYASVNKNSKWIKVVDRADPNTKPHNYTVPLVPTEQTVHLFANSPNIKRATASLFIRNGVFLSKDNNTYLIVVRGTIAAIQDNFGVGSYSYDEEGYDYQPPGYLSYSLDETKYSVLFSNCPKQSTVSPPPPAQRKRECCEMSCCPQPRNPDNDALLKKLLKKVEDLDKKIGEFPATVPETFISERQGFIGSLLPKRTIEINSHVEMWDWFVRRFDEIVGELKIYIEVKDVDPTKPGDQPQGIVLPNFAEAIAEMFGLLLQISINSETATTLLIKILVESGAAKQQGFTNFSYVKAIADYLNFKREDKTAPIQLSFTPNSDSLESFIKEAKVNADIVELDDDEQDFNVSLTKLLKSAAIIDSVYLKRFEKGSDIAKQIVELVQNRAKAYEELTKKNKETEDTNWNQFLESVEMGHINSSGISDSTNPYGVPFEERPRIKELGLEQTNAD
jgi:hypothetical protein